MILDAALPAPNPAAHPPLGMAIQTIGVVTIAMLGSSISSQLVDLAIANVGGAFSISADEIADTTSDLTVVGSEVVFGADDFARFDEGAPPPAMPDWSPVRTFGGYAAWGDKVAAGQPRALRDAAEACGCAHACTIHGHQHPTAWSSRLSITELKSCWGALGCACWAV